MPSISEFEEASGLREIEFRAQNFFELNERFDLIVAFEVLEHYEQDLDCLRKWLELLQPGGTLIFSVPAHMRQWTKNDTRAGHARRYEKKELLEKLEACGFRCRAFLVLRLSSSESDLSAFCRTVSINNHRKSRREQR